MWGKLGPFAMTGKRIGSGVNESRLKHTKRMKTEPNLDEYDVKIEPVEDIDPLLIGHFDDMHSNGDHMAKSANCMKTIIANEDQPESQLDVTIRELKKEEEPFIMTRRRNGSGEMEAPPKHAKITMTEPNSDECDIKVDPVEDHDPLLSENFDDLQTNDDDHTSESVNHLSSFVRNISGSKLPNWKCASIGIGHQKSDKQLTTENLSKPRSVKIDDSLNSVKKGTEMKACSYRADKISEMKKHSLSHSEKPSSDVSHSFKSGGTPVPEASIIYSEKKDFFCTFCSYGTNRRWNLREHVLTHTREKPFSCEQCSFKTTHKNTLKGHILTHTGEKPFSCEHCSYQTTHKGHLNQHILIHTGEKHFSCGVCSFRTAQKGHLKQHILAHTGEKPFSCEQCLFKTTHKKSLEGHILTHTEVTPFSCEHCSYQTIHKGLLNQHILTHIGKKPFSCEICSFKTTHKGDLNKHMLTHTGERPFSCEFCSFKSTQKGSLNRHILTHTGERPFSCQLCSFKSTRKGSLNEHILTHTRDNPV